MDPWTEWTEAAIESLEKAILETQRMLIAPIVEDRALDAHAQTLRQALAAIELIDRLLRDDVKSAPQLTGAAS